MIISFIQGIISYPSSGNLQGFLSKAGQYVSFVADNGHTDIAIAHGDTNYLVSESVSIANAWGPLQNNTDYWLYWDINTTTAVRTFGFTTHSPIYSVTKPTNVDDDQHWFDLSSKKMYVLQNARWREVIRVFAAKVNNNIFSPLGSGYPLKPFAGTQVGLYADNTQVGRIIADDVGKPIRRANGQFFTSMSDFFLDGSPVNSVRLESGIIVASALTNMAKFQVVKFSEFDKILPANYNDTETTAIAILMEDALFGSTVSVCIQGCVTNPDWNWTTVGQTLWIGDAGALVSVDPYLSNPVAHPVAKAPVGRVLSPTSIIFDQGLGSKGEKGDPGSASSGLATNVVYGNVRLTVAAATGTDPVVVGDNDPRNSNARVPLAHNQAATTITTAPHGTLTGVSLDLQLAQLEDNKVAKAGDTMTGPLVLAADPAAPLQAATKQYVDSRPVPTYNLDSLTDVTITSPTATQILQYNGTQWVNAANSGGGTPDLNLVMDSEVITWSKTVPVANGVQQMWRFNVGDLNGDTGIVTVHADDSPQTWSFLQGSTQPYPGTIVQNSNFPDLGSELLYTNLLTSTMPATTVTSRRWTIESIAYARFSDFTEYNVGTDRAVYQIINLGGSHTLTLNLIRFDLDRYQIQAVPSWDTGNPLYTNQLYWDQNVHICVQISDTEFRVYGDGYAQDVANGTLPGTLVGPYAVSVGFDGSLWTKASQLFMDELRISSKLRYQVTESDPDSMTLSFYSPVSTNSLPFPRETSFTATIALGGSNEFSNDGHAQLIAGGAPVVTSQDNLDILRDVRYPSPPQTDDVLRFDGSYWVPATLPSAGGNGDTFIVELLPDNPVNFGTTEFNSVFTGFTWNVIMDTPQVQRNSASGYNQEIVIAPQTAYRVTITSKFSILGTNAPWPDGSTVIGSRIDNGFASASALFATASTQTHNLWTPSGSVNTSPDGNSFIRTAIGSSDQTITDTYIVYNTNSNSNAAIKFAALAARAGATLTPDPTVDITMLITIERLTGNLQLPV